MLICYSCGYIVSGTDDDHFETEEKASFKSDTMKCSETDKITICVTSEVAQGADI